MKYLFLALLICGCCPCPDMRDFDRALDNAKHYQDSLKLEIQKLKKEVNRAGE